MKTIIITGASDGLGKAFAELCVKNNIRVVNVSRTQCAINKVENISCDLTSEQDIIAAANIIKTKFPQFTALVNCAGIISLQSANEITYDELERTIKVNVLAPIFLTSQLFDLLKDNEADIMNVGSTVGTKGYKDQSIYGASKWALRGVSENLRVELSKTNCRVIQFNPGGMYSNFFGKYKGTNEFDGDPLEWMLPSDISKVMFDILNYPKQIEVSEITINRKGRRI